MSEKPKHKLSNLQKWFIRGLLLVSLVIVIAGVWLFALSQGLMKVYAGEKGLGMASQILHLGLPQTTYAPYVHSFIWQPNLRYIRFEAASGDVQDWLEDNDFCFLLFQENTGNSAFFNDVLLDWWRPNDASNYRVSECGENPHYQIFIDQSDAGLWIVYLQVYRKP